MKDYRFNTKSKRPLDKYDTSIDRPYESDTHWEAILKGLQEKLSGLQERLYAEANQSFLLILQGMDTSGKDSLVKHVFSGINPQGCRVTAFKAPSSEEMSHDFLWRTNHRLPAKGEIGIFNRSYYEDFVMPSVHPNLIHESNLPERIKKKKDLLKERLVDIRNHEDYLERQGIKIVKVFLHISKRTQKQRLVARIDEPLKRWKMDADDFLERKLWRKYEKAYEEAFRATSTKTIPWHIVPSDDKKTSRILVSKILIHALEEMNPRFPKMPKEQRQKLIQMGKLVK